MKGVSTAVKALSTRVKGVSTRVKALFTRVKAYFIILTSIIHKIITNIRNNSPTLCGLILIIPISNRLISK